ncbi:hypothetical protein JMN32_20450 [Fulvivirga sp. 29W222]|uniref:Metal-dependent HD superfamily phosphohydrolase n=1 Tax=Fulvivirga marina TaxID=2494733 RepID=A0A937G2C0_9BACT|nr:hypothetical protein [Fulvivirga marina]
MTLKYTDDRKLVEELWEEIRTHYTCKHRHYHNLDHLHNLLEQLTEVKAQIKNWDVVLFALFYHDLIYNPVKRDNEEKSARWAEKQLKVLNVPKEVVEKCVRQIRATKGHAEAVDGDINLFTDADLSILGCDYTQYKTYKDQVRREYHIYPDMLYKPGRKKVLLHFLNMDRIFKTSHFFDKFENQARQNLQSELEGL